jgi:hypothetical protein
LSDRQTRQIVALLADQFEPIGTDSKRVRAALALVALGIFALLIHDRALNGSLPAFPIGEAEIGSHTSGVGKMNHNTVRALAAGMMSVGIATVSANAQSAVQWRVEDGGNGHWYAWTALSSVYPVVEAACAVQGGHLVTLTTLAEWQWVKARFPISYDTGAFTGGFQDPSAPSFAEPNGGWKWVTGEPFVISLAYMSAFDNCPGGTAGQCNCGNPGAQDILFFSGCCNNFLDDVNDGLTPTCDIVGRPGIIEWSADCNNDSIIDYGQILAGELEDLNANNIPDCCEGGVPCSCPADLDGNGEINSIDLAIILDKFGTDGGKDYPNADVDGSGIVDAADLTAILSGWGACQ